MQGPVGGARLPYTVCGTDTVYGNVPVYAALGTPPVHTARPNSGIFGFRLGLRPGQRPFWTPSRGLEIPFLGIFDPSRGLEIPHWGIWPICCLMLHYELPGLDTI